MAPSTLPDLARLLGAVPVSGGNLYKLLAAKETVFLLPGGMREAVKRKGESYKLIWPAKPEFVRTAMRHGAVIIPMAAVGGDEFIKIVLDQQQIMSLPIVGEQLQRLGNQMPRARCNLIPLPL
jgi:1-acyl-sn-glycerol-3-phosphate acyltransferase